MSQEQGNANLDAMNELLRDRRAKTGVSLDDENAALKEMYEARHALVLKQEEKLLRLWEELANLRQESEEQARLLGISGSKEARLLAELAQAKRDSERYRWLRDSGTAAYWYELNWCKWDKDTDFDSAIDAAMAAQGEQHE